MNKTNSKLLGIILGIFLIGTIFTTFSLISLTATLNESGLSIGTAKAASYSFNNSSMNIDELPDMAGGC